MREEHSYFSSEKNLTSLLGVQDTEGSKASKQNEKKKSLRIVGGGSAIDN